MERQKPGRKKMPEDQKTVMVAAYVTGLEKKAILKKYGSLTLAVKNVIIPNL
jgi:hypothetical protein